jgi:amidophosphoribosyltransferase
MKEKCGVFGIYSSSVDNKVIPNVINGLKKLQHRGQEGCGIAYDSSSNLNINKGLGLVNDVFPEINNFNIPTNKCIGHVRYSTSGKSKINNQSKLDECQPLLGNVNNKGNVNNNFYLVHNGNIPSVKIHDTKFIINFIEDCSQNKFENKLIELIETIPCAYSLLILFNNCLYAIRDRYGIRPLCIGNYKDSYCISSESCALQHYNLLRDVYPGEIIKFDNNGLNTIYKSSNSQLSICAFEYLYFLRPNSICDGLSVNDVRTNLGITLANNDDLTIDNNFIVIGIPDSGIIAAKGYANKLNIQYKQSINKNKNSNRTFIIPNNEDRIKACKEKFVYNQEEIINKKVIIVDDTIVRGNVMKNIVENLWLNNVKEIHIRIAAPPIINICQLGIDIPSCEELIAYKKTIHELKNIFNVTSIQYLNYNDFTKLIPENSYKECFGEKINDNLINCNVVKT